MWSEPPRGSRHRAAALDVGSKQNRDKKTLRRQGAPLSHELKMTTDDSGLPVDRQAKNITLFSHGVELGIPGRRHQSRADGVLVRGFHGQTVDRFVTVEPHALPSGDVRYHGPPSWTEQTTSQKRMN